MCRTPSPVKVLPRFGSLQKLWSPGLDKRVSRDTSSGMMGMEVVKEKENIFADKENMSQDVAPRSGRSGGGSRAFKRKSRGWYEKAKAPTQEFAAADGGVMEGNWI